MKREIQIYKTSKNSGKSREAERERERDPGDATYDTLKFTLNGNIEISVLTLKNTMYYFYNERVMALIIMLIISINQIYQAICRPYVTCRDKLH